MKEKIEKLLKSHLKRKLTITTATLIAFLLSSNLAMAGQYYQVGNGKIERNNKDATEYLGKDKTGLFKISETNIVNRLKDSSNFTLLAEVNKPFINEGSIKDLRNNGKGKIENRGFIWDLKYSATENEIENRGFIVVFTSKGNITNRGYISSLHEGNNMVNDSYIHSIYATIKNTTNNGLILNIAKNPAISEEDYINSINSIDEIVNNGIIRFDNNAIYDRLKNNGKLTDRGIAIDKDYESLKYIAPDSTIDSGIEIKNYNNSTITDTSIDNKILNAYRGKIENDLEVKNNSILNIWEGKIEANKLIIDNSTVNAYRARYIDKLELEFKNNSKIGYLEFDPNIREGVIANLTMDNTTEVGEINAVGDIKAINLVPNENIANKNKVLRINRFEADQNRNINTYISTNVDLLGGSDLGNITVEDKGRLTIAKDALKDNGYHGNKYYKKDITIKKGGKIIIGIDPYNIGQIEKLGDGNNLTESVIGQNDPDKTTEVLPQGALGMDTNSILHDIVILDGEEVDYVGLGKRKLRNRYKVIVAKELATPIPEEPEPDNGGNTPDNGGSTPDNGGNTPDNGGSTPDNGGSTPDNGGSTPDNGGSTPDNGGNTPDNGGSTPDNGGNTPDNGGNTPDNGGSTPDNGANPPSGGTPNPPSGANPPSSVPPDYPVLNGLYKILLADDKVKEYSVYSTEQLFGLYEYLRDMYANSPYALSAETSFRNLAMLRDNAYLDLKPNLNKWAVMGGLSHSDRENKFKHELGTTEADTITTGAYAKGEYGLKEDTTLGLILGGTNSKSDLLTGKVKGSSIYLGAYAKKYVNNFKFTLGTGIDLGEYKVDRNAIGYAGIIETEKYSAKQKNRAFDLYAEARYSKDLGNNFYLEPNFNLAYSRVRQGGATENDGKVNLDIKSKTFNQTTAALGLDLKKVLLNGNTSHSFALGTAYERVLSGAKENSIRASLVGGSGSGFDILVPAKEKGRTSIGAEYKLENKVGILFNLKMDYGFKHGSDKKDIRFSTGLGYKF